MSARISGSRSGQRSARFRMLSVATCSGPSASWAGRCQADGVRDREGERERRAGALGRLDPDPPAVLLDDVAGDGQAEARSPAGLARGPRPVDLVEALEDRAWAALRDADARDPRPTRPPRPSSARDRHDDLAAVRAELHRVVDEVDDDLAEPGRIATDGRQVAADVDLQRDALALGEQPQPLGDVGGERAEVDAVDS